MTTLTDRVNTLAAISMMSLAIGTGVTPAEAATVTQDQSAFLNQLRPGFYLETFDSLARSQLIPSSINFSGNGYSYTASVVNNSSNKNFFNVGSVGDVWLSTNNSRDTIRFNFTSNNVTAIGGSFFPTNIDGNVVSGRIDLALSDGTTKTLTNSNNSSFLGFISPEAFITSLTVVPDGNTWVTVNNLYVGQTIPTPALLPGLVGVGFGVLRKRKRAVA